MQSDFFSDLKTPKGEVILLLISVSHGTNCGHNVSRIILIMIHFLKIMFFCPEKKKLIADGVSPKVISVSDDMTWYSSVVVQPTALSICIHIMPIYALPFGTKDVIKYRKKKWVPKASD